MKKKTLLPFAIIGIALFTWSCNPQPESDKHQANQGQETTHDKATQDEANHTNCDQVDWAYTGETAPDKWASLCTGFSACGGAQQSPIDLTAAEVDATLTPLAFDYHSSATNILNNGHTIQFNIDSGSTLTIDEKKYDLLQLHFHAASEHTVNGEHYPMEVHFVHRATDTDFAVVGIFFEEGKSNQLLAKYLEHFPKEKGEYADDSTLDLATLLPDNQSYFHYSGSLTTPPCSEVVSWYVLQKPLTATKEQLEAFASILHDNYRPVQALNERKLVASK